MANKGPIHPPRGGAQKGVKTPQKPKKDPKKTPFVRGSSSFTPRNVLIKNPTPPSLGGRGSLLVVRSSRCLGHRRYSPIKIDGGVSSLLEELVVAERWTYLSIHRGPPIDRGVPPILDQLIWLILDIATKF